ncbi:MAG: DNA polymerase III subunit beta [Acidobacteria bacterium]|nr:DNA polymerase III subunit beta [Acidobacteriota bacterium]MDW7984137.1 DNA polymerase III subunit beta [Acidobacteriota bacterium]
MKVAIEKDPFFTELRLIQGAIEKKSAIPTLSYFLMEAEENRLRLTASDMELSYQSTILAQVATRGRIALPAKVLVDVVRTLPEGPITIELVELPRVLLEAGRSSFELLGLSPDDYPIPQVPSLGDAAYVLPAWVLRRAIDYTDFVIPKHTLREAFLGMLLEKRGEVLSAAAMDIYRLAYYESRWEGSSAVSDFSLLIHRKALAELKNALAADAFETVRFGVSGHLITFELGHRRISIRMIDDTFPEYRSFIPESAPYRIQTQRLPLLEAFRRVVLLAKGTPVASAPSVRVEPKDGSLELRFQHPAVGTARDVVEATVYGSPFPVYVNGEFLVEFLSAVQDEEVELWFKSTREPAAVRPVGIKAMETYCYVYMPIAEAETAGVTEEAGASEEEGEGDDSMADDAYGR